MAKRRQIFIWRDDDIDYLYQLADHLGHSARYQFYSLMFREKKIPELGNIRVPAIFSGKGKTKFYSFVIKPENLLKFAFVHHRRNATAELLNSYQRMIKRTRLKQISDFITGGGYFPNNIIINFTKKPRFEKKSRVGDIVYGILIFPPYYASADGQHCPYL